MSKISIVIPVFNAALYISRCIESFLNQTFKDFELILVNDGSTDCTNEILYNYSQLDARIIVIDKENKGVSAARQTGLETAKGKYLIFADSDDWVEPCMLDSLYEKAENENSDIVICDFYIDASKTSRRIVHQLPSEFCTNSIIKDLITGKLHGATWNKLYKRSIIADRNIKFPQDLNYCEDLWFNCELLLTGDIMVSYLSEPFYHYDHYSNDNGLSRRLKEESLNDYLKFYRFISNRIYDDNLLSIIKENAKLLAFRSDCDSKRYYSIFPEVNNCNKFTANIPLIYRCGNKLALKGQLKLGRQLVSIYDKYYLPVARFINRL